MVIETQPRPKAVDGDPAGALDARTVQDFEASFAARAAYRLAQNAVSTTSVDDIALNRGVVT